MTDSQQIDEDKPKHPGGRPRKYKSVRAMTMAINKYFTDDVIPTKAGLTLHLGFVNKTSLHDYRNNFPEFTPLIDKTFMLLEKWWEERLAGSACTGATFWLKNNAGYTDKQDITSREGEQPEDLTLDEIKELKRLAGLASKISVRPPEVDSKAG